LGILYPIYGVLVRWYKDAPSVISTDMIAWDFVNGGGAFPQIAIVYALIIEQPIANFLNGNEIVVAVSAVFMLTHTAGHPFRQIGHQNEIIQKHQQENSDL